MIVGSIPLATSSTWRMVGFGSQLSETVPSAKSGSGTSSRQLTVESGGQMSTGGCWSTTVMLNEQVARSPRESVAVQVTVLTPTGKAEPEGGLQTIVTAPMPLLGTGS